MASILHDKDLVRQCIWPAGIVASLAGEDVELDWEEVDLQLLAETYLTVMQRFASAHPPPLEVLPLRYNVQDKMREIYQRVAEDDLVPLMRHLQPRSDPEELVVVIVAALELVRLGAIQAEQRVPFAEIYLRKGRRPFDEASLEKKTDREGADAS